MALTDNTRGALLMAASMAAFTFNDACMKALAGDMHFLQALALRGILTTTVLVGITYASGGFAVRISGRDWGLLTLRTGCEVLAALLFLSALFHMPLANLSAILQALPLTVTLAGALVFREKIGWRRLTAILVGFVGVLLIVRPGAEGFTIYSVYGVLSVLAVTVRDLAVRRMAASVPSTLTALLAAAGVTLLGAGGLFFVEWVTPTPLDLAKLAGAAVFVIAGYLTVVMAMRVGEVAVVAPFRYFSLVVALVLGYVVFGDWPTPLTLLGALIVVGTGLFTLYREARLGRVRKVRPPAR